jgi:cystathionine beta-lyase
MWVADMDFPSPEPVIQAIIDRVEHRIFGYPMLPEGLAPVVVERMEKLYQWKISPEELVFIPGVVTGLNLACHAFTCPGDGVLVQPPVYPPFLGAPGTSGAFRQEAGLVRTSSGSYEIDWQAFEAAITPQTRLFILCNPHNPVGKVFSRTDLEKMAEICLRHRLIICSDEIHCDLLFPGYHHIPIATVGPEVAEQSITLMAPSKTFNLPGLSCGFAVIQNPKLQEIWKKAILGLVPSMNIMGQAAALAAYREGQEWLEQVLLYLDTNRYFLSQYTADHLPGVHMTRMEGTYLAWLDCRGAGLPEAPQEFFLKEAKVALNDGAEFGRGGEGFVRLNFACPRKTLKEALERMSTALEKI